MVECYLICVFWTSWTVNCLGLYLSSYTLDPVELRALEQVHWLHLNMLLDTAHSLAVELYLLEGDASRTSLS